MQLFNPKDGRQVSAPSISPPRLSSLPSEQTLTKDFASLENHVTAYCSLTNVYAQVVTESFSFVDKNNHILFNEYIKTIAKNLNAPTPITISQEAIDHLPAAAINHHISLEGMIADIWKKIKDFFAKIYDAVKGFFKTYFTRLGRLKNKLKNLEEVLKETDKDLLDVNIDNPPGGIASKYPFEERINLSLVEEIFRNVAQVKDILIAVDVKSKDIANQDILDRDFVARLKSLKDKIKSSGEQIDKNNKDKTGGLGLLKKENRDKNKQLNEDNKNLSDLKKDSEKELKGTEGKVDDVNSDNADVILDDGKEQGFNKAKAEFKTLLTELSDKFKPLIKKRLVNGVTITDIKVDEDSGIELETDTDKNKPDSVGLTAKGELIRLIKETTALLESVEKLTDNYTKINDQVIKNIESVDKIIKDLDGTTNEALGKYKTVLEKKVKERLTLMKAFFSTYNKVNKTLFGLVIDAAEGNVEYTVLCLKHFGKK